MSTIRPSSELRNKYNEMASFCRKTKEPVYITVNGRGDTVLLNNEVFDQLIAELNLLKMLAESEADIRDGKVAPIKQTFDDIRKKLN